MRLKQAVMDTRVLEDLNSLSNDLCRLKTEQESSDIDFVTGREETRHRCHVSIFSVRCQHFLDVVSNNSQPTPDGKPLVKMFDVKTSLFSSFKHYVYSGKLVFDGTNIFELIKLSETFGVSSLISLALEYINSSLTLSSVSDLLNQYVDVFNGESAENETFKRILVFIRDHIFQLRDSKLIRGFSKPALIRLLKSNSLDIDENEVWRLSLEWARLQVGMEDSLPPKQWTEEQRNQVRSVMDGVVQCIRVLHIDSSVFAEEVEPTGAIPIELSLERYRHAALPDKFQAKSKPAEFSVLTDSRNDFQSHPGGSRVENARALPRPDPRRKPPPGSRLAEDMSRLNPRVESDPRPTPYQRSAHHGPGKLIHGSSILASLSSETSFSYYEKILNSWTGSPNQAWTVIYRGSDHAFSAQAFHRLCDGAAPSYVLVKADTGKSKLFLKSNSVVFLVIHVSIFKSYVCISLKNMKVNENFVFTQCTLIVYKYRLTFSKEIPTLSTCLLLFI